MPIVFEGKTYDQDWHEIDAMGRRIGPGKDWRANADWAGKTGGQNPYTNEAGSSPHDATGFIPGNEPGSTLPKGPAGGGFLDYAKMDAYRRSLMPQAPRPSASSRWSSPYIPSSSQPSRGAVSGGSAGGDFDDFNNQITQAYRSFLGRDPGGDDAQKWWSGAYGHGSGSAGLPAIIAAIQNSDEAKQRGVVGQPSGDINHHYNQPTPPIQPLQSTQDRNLDYWSSQGVPTTQMFDMTTGQMLPGWQRTGRGYERTGGTTTTPGPQNGNFEGWFQQLVQGKRISPKTLKELEPILNQHGIKLGPLNARGFTDGIILPDGTFIDVILSATEDGGQGWGWIRPTGGVGGHPVPPSQYSDPYSSLLESLIGSRIGGLQGGYDDFARRQYETALQDRARSLSSGNAQLDQLMGYLQERFTDLKKPGFTGAENEVIRTSALDPIEQDRSAAKQRILTEISRRGIDPKSGIAQEMLAEVDRGFDAIRGTTQTQLASTEMARREDRASRAQSIGAQLADIPDARAREQLDVFGALEKLSMLARQEDEARSREAISYGGVLSDMGPQRLQLAMQAAGMGGNPSSLGALLTQIAGMNQNASAFNQGNSNSLWSGLGSLAAILSRQQNAGLRF